MRRWRLFGRIDRPVAAFMHERPETFDLGDERVDLVLLLDHDGIQLVDGIGRMDSLVLEHLKALLELFGEFTFVQVSPLFRRRIQIADE